jgi:hypothetical protein
MTNPIIVPKKITTEDNKKNKFGIDENKFKVIIKEIYDLMLHYSTARNILLVKNNPIRIGGILFWFETDKKTGESYLKYHQPPSQWKEDEIIYDIDTHLYNLYGG